MRLATTIATLAALAGLFAPAPATAAPGDKVCWVDGPRLHCETDDGSGTGTPGGGGDDGGGGGTRPTAYWTISLVPEQMGDGDANGPCLDTNGVPGRTYRYVLRDAATSEILDSFTRCVAAGDPAAVIGAPPSAPPTAAELQSAAPIPEPAILANPGGRGLTGLESRFWAAADGPVAVSVTIRGWSVTGTLAADEWTWTTGDGGRYESPIPGSAAVPAARHVYETKDTWPVSLEVSWSGSYTVSGFGTSYTVTGLAAEGASTLDYEVIEVRGVVDEPQPAA